MTEPPSCGTLPGIPGTTGPDGEDGGSSGRGGNFKMHWPIIRSSHKVKNNKRVRHVSLKLEDL